MQKKRRKISNNSVWNVGKGITVADNNGNITISRRTPEKAQDTNKSVKRPQM